MRAVNVRAGDMQRASRPLALLAAAAQPARRRVGEENHEANTMATKKRFFHRFGSAIGFLALLFVPAGFAHADCAVDASGGVYCGGGRCVADRNGTIWCARAYLGDAVRTRDGSVLCGAGQCETDWRGQVHCSAIVGGAVLRDSGGRVRCYGRCERAAADRCEHTPADVSG